jgi:hypothetical protein
MRGAQKRSRLRSRHGAGDYQRRKLNEEQRAAADALMDQYMSALGVY